MLYIPGSPFASRTQRPYIEKDSNTTKEGNNTKKEDNIKKKEGNYKKIKPLDDFYNNPNNANQIRNSELSNNERKQHEFTSREKYELQLIKYAKKLGMPILAVCAGSWRVLESYGGETVKLPKDDIDNHYNSSNLWSISHPLNVPNDSLLNHIMKIENKDKIEVNSTHWAAANISNGKFVKNNLSNQDPNDSLSILALEGDKWVEAFCNKFGHPVLALQWHPESYLPGNPGYNTNDDNVKKTVFQNCSIFEFMTLAAVAYKYRRSCVKQANETFSALKNNHKPITPSNIKNYKNSSYNDGIML
jgi:putative glutamine amidotransferase